MRIEAEEEAKVIDERLLDVWAKHPLRIVSDTDLDFLRKAGRAIAALRDLVIA